jgi:mRNA-degrading endonuclease YafQ of YafQ-DinJ toxin-antitoxin module
MRLEENLTLDERVQLMKETQMPVISNKKIIDNNKLTEIFEARITCPLKEGYIDHKFVGTMKDKKIIWVCVENFASTELKTVNDLIAYIQEHCYDPSRLNPHALKQAIFPIK